MINGIAIAMEHRGAVAAVCLCERNKQRPVFRHAAEHGIGIVPRAVVNDNQAGALSPIPLHDGIPVLHAGGDVFRFVVSGNDNVECIHFSSSVSRTRRRQRSFRCTRPGSRRG